MVPTDVSQFIGAYGPLFENEAVRACVWGEEDADFGRTVSWDVRAFEPAEGQTVQANASVDFQLTQVTLSVSERDMSQGGVPGTDTDMVFIAAIQFEDRTIAVNSESREFTEQEIANVIREFNEVSR